MGAAASGGSSLRKAGGTEGTAGADRGGGADPTPEPSGRSSRGAIDAAADPRDSSVFADGGARLTASSATSSVAPASRRGRRQRLEPRIAGSPRIASPKPAGDGETSPFAPGQSRYTSSLAVSRACL